MRYPFIRPAGLCLMVVLVILLVAARAQKPQEPDQAQIDRDRAIQVVRVINAAEYEYRIDHGRFGSWYEVHTGGVRGLLVPSRQLPQQLQLTNPSQTFRDLSIAPGTEVIPGYRLTLIVAGEGMTYSISLHDMKSHGCGLSIFSDQSGLIYEGTIIDCPQIVDDPDRTRER
jgi:hypothetical protein